MKTAPFAQDLRPEMTPDHWEHFHHGADIGVRGTGRAKEVAFAQAALALTAVMTDPAQVLTTHVIALHCEAPDDDLLLLDWLNALVYEIATRRMLFSRFDVKITGHTLDAAVWGEPVDVARHQPAVEIKGATCTELSVHQTGAGVWIAQCVVDV